MNEDELRALVRAPWEVVRVATADVNQLPIPPLVSAARLTKLMGREPILDRLHRSFAIVAAICNASPGEVPYRA